jgi:hypothetical protein
LPSRAMLSVITAEQRPHNQKYSITFDDSAGASFCS